MRGDSFAALAALNERETGWSPSPPAISQHARKLGLPPRHVSRFPKEWGIQPQHLDDVESHMLEAYLRTQDRGGTPGSDTDRWHIGLLNKLLFGGRGVRLIFCYHEEIGFYLVKRQPGDGDDAVFRVTSVNLNK